MRRPLDRFDAGQMRILGGLKVGDQFEESDVILTPAAMGERMKEITEPLEWYAGPSPWGGAIATPAAMVQLLYASPIASLRGKLGAAVGLFGAIEIRSMHGPVLVDQRYRVIGNIVSLGQSPKTEYMWFETALDDSDRKRIAEMRMLLRFMKASSPLYQDS
jgi:hypothetical protein